MAGAVGLILYQAMATSGKWKWGFIAIVISLMGLAISFDISKTTNTRIDMENIQTWSSSRLEIWDASLSLLPKAPLIGTGKGGFVDAYAVVKQSLNHTVTNHTHQEIIEVLINFGWLGGGIFLFLWFYTIRCGFARIKSTKPKQEKRWVKKQFSI